MIGFHNRVWLCLLRGTSFIFKYNSIYSWLRRLVAGVSPRRPRFDPSSIHVRVVEKKTLEQGFLRVPLFSLSSSFHISSILVLFCMMLLQEGQMSFAWEPSKKECFSKIREQWIEAYFHVVCKGLRKNIDWRYLRTAMLGIYGPKCGSRLGKVT